MMYTDLRVGRLVTEMKMLLRRSFGVTGFDGIRNKYTRESLGFIGGAGGVLHRGLKVFKVFWKRQNF